MFSYDLTKYSWKQINSISNLIPPRSDHSLVVYNNNLYIFGGFGINKLIFDDFFQFNFSKNIWIAIIGEGIKVKPRFGHTANVFHNTMFVFGGWDGKKCLNELLQYSFSSNFWYISNDVIGNLPSSRYRHDSTIWNENLIVFGGISENQIRYNDLFMLNIIKKEWKEIETKGCIPSPRTFHKIICFENSIFCLGNY